MPAIMQWLYKDIRLGSKLEIIKSIPLLPHINYIMFYTGHKQKRSVSLTIYSTLRKKN